MKPILRLLVSLLCTALYAQVYSIAEFIAHSGQSKVTGMVTPDMRVSIYNIDGSLNADCKSAGKAIFECLLTGDKSRDRHLIVASPDGRQFRVGELKDEAGDKIQVLP
jgi:hypothetical protein